MKYIIPLLILSLAACKKDETAPPVIQDLPDSYMGNLLVTFSIGLEQPQDSAVANVRAISDSSILVSFWFPTGVAPDDTVRFIGHVSESGSLIIPAYLDTINEINYIGTEVGIITDSRLEFTVKRDGGSSWEIYQFTAQ